MPSHDTDRRSIAELAATRMALWDAVKYLTEDKRELLYDVVSGVVADMRARWGSEPSSGFKKGFLDELEKIKFRLAQRHEFRRGHDETGFEQSEFVCIRCDVFAVGHGSSLSCPSCGTADWLELWRFG